MTETILGLDIGSDSVKAVLTNSSGRMVARVLAFERVRLAGGVDLDAALGKIAARILPLAPAKISCVVSLPPSEFMFRRINLPFRDESKIKKTLCFELEPLLPLPIDEVLVDYMHLAGDGLLAAAGGKEKIRNVLDAVETHCGDVSIIDISTAALVGPLLEQKSLTGSGILLDIGALSTFAVFYEKNALVQIRSFAFGGNTITQALAEDLSCALPAAEQIKIDAAYGIKKDKALAVCREFCVSLANTVEFVQLNENMQGPPAQIIITGGGSLFKELGQELAKTFGVPVTAFDSGSSGQSDSGEKIQNSYSPAIMNTALAAVKRSFASRKSFNFRQGEFARKSLRGNLKKQLPRAAVIAAIILLLAAVDFSLDYFRQAAQAGALKKQISMIFKKHYPPSAVMVDPVSQLKTKLAEDRKAYGLDNGRPGVTILELFKDLSTLISPALDIVLTQMHYENDVVLLKGEAKKIDDVTNVKNELLKSKYFKNVAISQTALAKDGAKVNFDLRIELQ